MTAPLTNSADCESYLKEIWERNTIESHERVYAVYFSHRGQREMNKCICKGAYGGTLFDIREVTVSAIVNHFDYVVIAHNHPSGDCQPSPRDRQATRQIYLALRAQEIILLDKLIITPHHDYFSFKDAKILDEYEKEFQYLIRKAG